MKLGELHRLPNGMVMYIGRGHPLRWNADDRFAIAWTDVDGETWSPSADNTAGDIRPPIELEPITLHHVRIRDTIEIFTNEGVVFELRQAPPPLIFELRLLERHAEPGEWPVG